MDNKLCIDWTDQPPFPQDLAELIHCGCKTGCGGNRCSCRRATLTCTDACFCVNCENSPHEQLEDFDAGLVNDEDDLLDEAVDEFDNSS